MTPDKKPNTRALQDHPWYFGHYLNMARYNAFVILSDLYEKLECSNSKISEGNLAGSLGENYKELVDRGADWERRLTRSLKRKFPFLNCPKAYDKDRKKDQEPMGKEVVNILRTALLTLTRLRNQYTHKHHPENTKPVAPMQSIFDYTVAEKLPRRYGELKNKRKAYKHLYEKGNDPVYDYRMHESESKYTERGLTFFICLFLEPLYAHAMLKSLGIFQAEQDAKRTITARCFTLNACKLPRPKLDSADILLDMLNELGRCPEKLYYCLSEEAQEKFLAESKTDTTDLDTPPPLMFRKRDRFPYFALRFFDDMDYFDRLRFQLQLGKWIEAKYEKRIGGKAHDRFILKPIRVFGKLKNFSPEHLPGDWKWRDPETGQMVYNARKIYQYAPHYNMQTNNIPLRILAEGEEEGFPEQKDRGDLSHKPEKLQKGATPKTIYNRPAQAILSTKQLMGLFLYQYLYKNPVRNPETREVETVLIEKSAEDYILNYLQNFSQLIADVKEGSLIPLVAPPFYTRAASGKFKKPEPEKLEERIAFLEKSIPRDEERLQNNQGKKVDRLKKVIGFKKNSLKEAVDRLAEIKKYEESKILMQEKLWKAYQIHLKDLPGPIREYLIGFKEDNFFDLVRKRIDFFKKENEERLAVFAKDSRRRPPKDGNAALWLSKDIVRLKKHEEDGKGMPNKDQYNVLQAQIALYPAHKHGLKKYFEELKLTGNKNQDLNHPFLHQIEPEKLDSTLAFYKAYLEKRKHYFETSLPRRIFKTRELKGRRGRVRKKITKTPRLDQGQTIYLFNHFLAVKRTKALNKNYDRVPVNLPRAFFNRPIAEALMKLKDKSLQVKATDNVVYCLKQYSNQSSQAFYDKYKRYAAANIRLPHSFLLDPFAKVFSGEVDAEHWTNLYEDLKEYESNYFEKRKSGFFKDSAVAEWKNPQNVIRALFQAPFPEVYEDVRSERRTALFEILSDFLEDAGFQEESDAFFERYEIKMDVEDEEGDFPKWRTEKEERLEQIKFGLSWLGEIKNREDEEEKVYRALKTAENQIYKREQEIRYVQSTDQAQWLMAKERMKKDWAQQTAWEQFTLENIGFDNKEVVVEEDTNRKVAISNILDYEAPMKLRFYLENQEREIFITDSKPVRKYGEFRKFLKDGRVQKLLHYKTGNKIGEEFLIPKEQIDIEIEEYNLRRSDFFKTVYEFEGKIYDAFKDDFPEKDLTKDYYKHSEYLEVAKQKLPEDRRPDFGFSILAELRNKFLHNKILTAVNMIMPWDDDEARREALWEKKRKGYAALKKKVDSDAVARSLFDQAEEAYQQVLVDLGLEVYSI